MEPKQRKKHWEEVFETKDTSQVSWYQPNPTTALQLIEKLQLRSSEKIIEVGSGDSYLGDKLLEKGFSDITLLDISENALDAVKERMGEKAASLTFECCDVTTFASKHRFKLWHDRAVFHFLTERGDIDNYIKVAAKTIESGGYLILGTFSLDGPDMCSALKVSQYSEDMLTDLFKSFFHKLECFMEDHITPSGSSQNFLHCVFKRK